MAARRTCDRVATQMRRIAHILDAKPALVRLTHRLLSRALDTPPAGFLVGELFDRLAPANRRGVDRRRPTAGSLRMPCAGFSDGVLAQETLVASPDGRHASHRHG